MTSLTSMCVLRAAGACRNQGGLGELMPRSIKLPAKPATVLARVTPARVMIATLPTILAVILAALALVRVLHAESVPPGIASLLRLSLLLMRRRGKSRALCG